ncbi:MAG: hypothetical protein EXS36_04890 [Pedosphaera sp.]|nr:hypothetical protein [Pedosphaera sp.]
MHNKILSSIDFAIKAINRIDSRLFIFSTLCLSLLSFTVYSNEEAYFGLAKQYIDPNWIPGSFTFTEWVGTRLVFQNIAGFALKFLSFEQLAAWGRAFSFLGYTFPLALLFKRLGISNFGIVILLTLFTWNGEMQHFFGKEWIFLSFESKVLAYIFVFWGYYFLLADKFHWASLFAALASWLHILVGGWFFVLVVLYASVSKLPLKQLIQVGMLYLLAILPFIGYLSGHLAESGPIINGVNIDWVYSFYRNAHHTAPMHTPRAFHNVLPRVVFSFSLLLLSIIYFRHIRDEHVHKLNRIALITLGIVFAGLLLTYIDGTGRFLKYYVFRIASIGAFSYYILILLYSKMILTNHPYRLKARTIGFIVIIPLFLTKVGINVNNLIHPKVNQELIELTAYVSEHTRSRDVFLFLQEDELSFARLARRESLIVFKFDPGGGDKIYEWYVRFKMKEHLQKDISYLDPITRKYRLDYLISRVPITYQQLKEVYHNQKYYLYHVVHKA